MDKAARLWYSFSVAEDTGIRSKQLKLTVPASASGCRGRIDNHVESMDGTAAVSVDAAPGRKPVIGET